MTIVAEAVPEVRKRPVIARGFGGHFLQRYGTLLILLLLCVVFTIIGPWRTAREPCNVWQQVTTLTLLKNGQVCGPVFASQVNILNLVRQVSVIGIVSLGEMLVILTGGIDLGVGSIVGFSGVIAAALQRANAGPRLPLLVPPAVGALAGLARWGRLDRLGSSGMPRCLATKGPGPGCGPSGCCAGISRSLPGSMA